MSARPIPSAPADLELIAQLKSRLQYAELRIRVLEERLRLMRIEKYGAGGEKLSQAQMQLFDLVPVVSEIVEQSESDYAPVHRSTKRSGKQAARSCLQTFLAWRFCLARRPDGECSLDPLAGRDVAPALNQTRRKPASKTATGTCCFPKGIGLYSL